MGSGVHLHAMWRTVPTDLRANGEASEEACVFHSKFRLVSFSVDPKWDTPAILGDYAKKWKADPERWLFLTGDDHVIHTLIEDENTISARAGAGNGWRSDTYGEAGSRRFFGQNSAAITTGSIRNQWTHLPKTRNI